MFDEIGDDSADERLEVLVVAPFLRVQHAVTMDDPPQVARMLANRPYHSLADFWHRAAEVPELIGLAEGQGRIDVAPPSPAELAEMIRKPAQASGLFFEIHPDTNIGLDAMLAQDAAAEPGVLPLLSFTLDALHAQDVTKTGGHMLTYGTYAALGGLRWRDVPGYVLAQIGGAFAGVAVAHGMFGEAVFSASRHSRAGGAQFLSELVATRSRYPPSRRPMFMIAPVSP